MYKTISEVIFPKPQDIQVNMMPFLFGDINSIPINLRQYYDIISKCYLEHEKIAYLTITESVVDDETQRRGGIHVEAPKMMTWGGGSWGGSGVFMASTDGACNVWDELVEERDEHGACTPHGLPIRMKSNTLYQLTDRTPHEALKSTGYRQFIRVVSNDISVWFSQHNTRNPLGIQPDCPVTDRNKFTH